MADLLFGYYLTEYTKLRKKHYGRVNIRSVTHDFHQASLYYNSLISNIPRQLLLGAVGGKDSDMQAYSESQNPDGVLDSRT